MARQNLKTISFNFFNSIVLRKTNFPEECLTKLRVQQNNMRLPGAVLEINLHSIFINM